MMMDDDDDLVGSRFRDDCIAIEQTLLRGSRWQRFGEVCRYRRGGGPCMGMRSFLLFLRFDTWKIPLL